MTQTFERRRLEVFFACLTAGFGLWLMFPSKAMASPALVHLAAIMEEGWWGALFLTNGLSHCAWLGVNGKRSWSPIVRFWAAFGSMGLYLMWSVGFATYDGTATGVYTYGALAVGAAWCCVFAWKDALTAMRTSRVADYT